MRWVAIFDDVPGTDEIRREHADAHCEFLEAHRDVIPIAGGLRPAPDEWYCGGLWVLEVETREAAVELIEHDPFFVHGLREGYRLFAWGKASFYGPVEL